MSYKIDIDVNTDQLEYINEALETSFSSFRAAINKLDAVIGKLGNAGDVIKNVPTFVTAKETIRNESAIISQFEKSGSVKFLNDTLNTTATAIKLAAKYLEKTGTPTVVDGKFNQSIEKLAGIFKTLPNKDGGIGVDNVGKKIPARLTTPSFQLDDKDLEAGVKLSVKNRITALNQYKKSLDTNTDLELSVAKEYEANLRALLAVLSSLDVSKNFQSVVDGLEKTGLSGTDISQTYQSGVGKLLPKTDSTSRVDDFVFNALKSLTINQANVEKILANQNTQAAKKETTPAVERQFNNNSGLTKSAILDLDTISISQIDIPYFKSLQKEIDLLAQSIIRTRGVLELPIVKTKGVDSYELLAGQLQLEAYKKAQSIDKTLPDRILVILGDDFTKEDTEQVRLLQELISKIPFEAVDIPENDKYTPGAIQRSGSSFDGIKTTITDVDTIEVIKAIQGFNDDVEKLAQAIVKSGRLLAVPTILLTGFEKYKAISNPLPIQAYNRATEIDPNLRNVMLGLQASNERSSAMVEQVNLLKNLQGKLDSPAIDVKSVRVDEDTPEPLKKTKPPKQVENNELANLSLVDDETVSLTKRLVKKAKSFMKEMIDEYSGTSVSARAIYTTQSINRKIEKVEKENYSPAAIQELMDTIGDSINKLEKASPMEQFDDPAQVSVDAIIENLDSLSDSLKRAKEAVDLTNTASKKKKDEEKAAPQPLSNIFEPDVSFQKTPSKRLVAPKEPGEPTKKPGEPVKFLPEISEIKTVKIAATASRKAFQEKIEFLKRLLTQLPYDVFKNLVDGGFNQRNFLTSFKAQEVVPETLAPAKQVEVPKFNPLDELDNLGTFQELFGQKVRKINDFYEAIIESISQIENTIVAPEIIPEDVTLNLRPKDNTAASDPFKQAAIDVDNLNEIEGIDLEIDDFIQALQTTMEKFGIGVNSTVDDMKEAFSEYLTRQEFIDVKSEPINEDFILPSLPPGVDQPEPKSVNVDNIAAGVKKAKTLKDIFIELNGFAAAINSQKVTDSLPTQRDLPPQIVLSDRLLNPNPAPFQFEQGQVPSIDEVFELPELSDLNKPKVPVEFDPSWLEELGKQLPPLGVDLTEASSSYNLDVSLLREGKNPLVGEGLNEVVQGADKILQSVSERVEQSRAIVEEIVANNDEDFTTPTSGFNTVNPNLNNVEEIQRQVKQSEIFVNNLLKGTDSKIYEETSGVQKESLSSKLSNAFKRTVGLVKDALSGIANKVSQVGDDFPGKEFLSTEEERLDGATDRKWLDYYDALILGQKAERPPEIPEKIRPFSENNINTTLLSKLMEGQWIKFNTAFRDEVESIEIPTAPVGKIDSLFDDLDFDPTSEIISGFENLGNEISGFADDSQTFSGELATFNEAIAATSGILEPIEWPTIPNLDSSDINDISEAGQLVSDIVSEIQNISEDVSGIKAPTNQASTNQVINGISNSGDDGLPAAGGGDGGNKKPPKPRKTASDGGDDEEPPKEKSEAQIFREARLRAAQIKDTILRGGVGFFKEYQAYFEDIFGEDEPKNTDKANLLVSSVNRWLQGQIKKFENAELADAKVSAKLGNTEALYDLESDAETQRRKIELAQKMAEKQSSKGTIESNKQAVKTEAQNFDAERKKLEAQLRAALTDTTENQVTLITNALTQIKNLRTYIEDNQGSFANAARFDRDGVEVNRLKVLENNADKRLDFLKKNPDKIVDTNSLQEMRAGISSIRTFLQDLQNFTIGLIQVSSAINKEVIKLKVANDNSIVRTEKDVADSTALAKKYGGSISSYLKDLANIKIADLSQVTQSGSLSPNRFLDSEVKSLVGGLRAAYSVNQLDAEAQDGASKAVAQMLSKGKIQAEELRGQLGDRLNGAVTLFAQALGISTAQLDRRLKEGSIMDVEVFKFGRLLERKYSEAAQAPTLIKETTALSGATRDILTNASQPVAGVVTVASQLLNAIADAIKANAATMALSLVPVGAIIAGGISKGVRDSFMTSSFASPILDGLGTSFRNNRTQLGVMGGGLALSAVGAGVFGAAGLDKTILKLGDQFKALVGILGNVLGSIGNSAKETKFGESKTGRAIFEILPLAALASPLTNYAIDKTKDIIEKGREKNAEAAQKAPPGQRQTLGQRASGFISTIPFLNIGAALVAGVAAYSIANTRFVSEYKDVTESMIRELRKSKKDESSFEKKVDNFKKNEGTENPFSLDGVKLGVTDLLNLAANNLESVSVAGLEDAISGSSGERKAELQAVLDKKIKEGYTPSNSTFAAGAAEEQIRKENDNVSILIKEISERFNPNYYQEEIAKASPIVAEYRAESQRLLAMQNQGGVPQGEIDVQQVKVQTLAVRLREAIPDMANAQADVATRIAKLEETKQNILNQDLAGAKERAALIDSELARIRRFLPSFTALISSMSAPNQAISDRKAEITSREKRIGLDRITDSTNDANARERNIQSRFYEGNDDLTNVREVSVEITSALANLEKTRENLTLATERKNLIANQTSSEGQQAEYEAALKAELEAMKAVSDGTLALTKARLDERKSFEELLEARYERRVRNFSQDNPDTDYFQTKAGAKTGGNLLNTIEFGTLSKAQFAFDQYLKIVPQLTLSADAVNEKLRELSDAVAASTLSLLEQKVSIERDRENAFLDSVSPSAPLRDTFYDRNNALLRALTKAGSERDDSTYLTKITRNALNSTQNPGERAALAVKLMGLETDAIRKKHAVEMAQIEIARAGYKRSMEVLGTILNYHVERVTNFGQTRQNQENRNLDNRFAQPNQFGAILTDNRQALERLNSAIGLQSQIRASNRGAQVESEKIFAQTVPTVSQEYRTALSDILKRSSASQVGEDQREIQAKIDLANNSGDRESVIETTNLGRVSIDVAEALVKLLGATAQIKQLDQAQSESVTQARNAYQLSTAAVVRARRQQESANRQSRGETEAEKDNNVGAIKLAQNNAQSQIAAIRARNAGVSVPLSTVLSTAEKEYEESLRRSQAAIQLAEKARDELIRQQREQTYGGTPVDESANRAIIDGENVKIEKLRVQLRATQIAGAQQLINTIAGVNTDVNSLFETVSSRLRESVDLLNRNLGIYGGQGLEGGKNPAINETLPETYTDKNGVVKVRERMMSIKYDPNLSGNKETAQLMMDMEKVNAEAQTKKALLEYTRKNLRVIQKGGVESTQQYQDVPELRGALKEIESLIISTESLADAAKILDQTMVNLDNSMFSESEKMKILNRKITRDRNNDIINQSDLITNSAQSEERRLASGRGMTDILRLLLGAEPAVRENEAQRNKAKAEYENSQLSSSAFERERGKVVYNDRLLELDDQFNKLPIYGNRLAQAMEDAVANGSKLSAVLSEAITKGDWSRVLTDLLSNIMSSLGDKFGSDASKGLGGLIGSGIQSIFGISAPASAPAAKVMGDLPSYNKGTLPCYADGNLPDGVEGKRGSNYPRTKSQDTRELSTSHVAIIGRDELVVPAAEVNAYVDFKRGILASSNVSNANNTSNANTYNSYQYSNYQSDSRDSFSRPDIYREQERENRAKRFA